MTSDMTNVAIMTSRMVKARKSDLPTPSFPRAGGCGGKEEFTVHNYRHNSPSMERFEPSFSALAELDLNGPTLDPDSSIRRQT